MAVENTISKVEGLGNGSATVFSFSPLRLFEPRSVDGGTHDLEVTRVNADLTEEVLSEGTGTNNYSVSVASYPGTGSVIFPASGAARLPTGAKLVIKRKVRLKQYENLNNRGGYFADTQEEMHDRHRMVDLQQQEELDRAVKVPIGDPTDPATLIADLKADAAAAETARAAAVVAQTAAELAEANAEAAAANLPNATTGGASRFLRTNAGATGWDYLTAVQARDEIVPNGSVTARMESDDAWSSVASAATVDLGAVSSRNALITGTTTITSFGNTGGEGRSTRVRFAGALTLTHNATSLILPSAANIITAAGDTAVFVKDSTASANWRCVEYQRASGQAVVSTGRTISAPVTTTSGTAVDLTGIASTDTSFSVVLNAVSMNANVALRFQLGRAGPTFETTGYSGQRWSSGSPSGITNLSNGFDLTDYANNAAAVTGRIQFTLVDASTNTWLAEGIFANPATSQEVRFVVGLKSMSGVVDRVRITSQNGTDTFDSGSVVLIRN